MYKTWRYWGWAQQFALTQALQQPVNMMGAGDTSPELGQSVIVHRGNWGSHQAVHSTRSFLLTKAQPWGFRMEGCGSSTRILCLSTSVWANWWHQHHQLPPASSTYRSLLLCRPEGSQKGSPWTTRQELILSQYIHGRTSAGTRYYKNIKYYF